MTRRVEEDPLKKHTVNLYDGDFQRLRDIHGSDVGAGLVIRKLVRRHIQETEKKVNQVKLPEVDGVSV